MIEQQLHALRNSYATALESYGAGKPIRVVGRAIGVGTSGWTDVWGGVALAAAVQNMTYSTAADIDSVVSTSATDTAKNVTVEGLTLAGVEVTQTVALNGQTRVALPTPLYRVNRFYGSGQTDLAGIVSVFAGAANHTAGVVTATALRGVIPIGDERACDGRFTVPAGKILFVTRLHGTNVKTSGTTPINSIRLLKRRGSTYDLACLVGVNSATLPAMEIEFMTPSVYTAGSDLLLRTDASAVSSVTSWLDGVLVDA